MNRTIQLTVGIAVAVLFFGLMISFTHKSLIRAGQLEITDKTTFLSGDELVVSWKTSDDTDGLVIYASAGDEWHMKDNNFRQVHRIAYNISSIPSGTSITYRIKSCGITGRCIKSSPATIIV